MGLSLCRLQYRGTNGCMHNCCRASVQYTKVLHWSDCENGVSRRSSKFQRFEVECNCPSSNCRGWPVVWMTQQVTWMHEIQFIGGWSERETICVTASGRRCRWCVLHKWWAIYSIDGNRREDLPLGFLSELKFWFIDVTHVCRPKKVNSGCPRGRNGCFPSFGDFFGVCSRGFAIFSAYWSSK